MKLFSSQVAEKIQEELEEYRSKEDDIRRMKHEMGVDGGETDAAIGMLSDNTQRLTSAVSSLPALLEKKRLIDMHTSIATAILEQVGMFSVPLFLHWLMVLLKINVANPFRFPMVHKQNSFQIKLRKLDVFFELEEKVLSKASTVDQKALSDLLEDPESGTPEDKLRLFVIYFLCSQAVTDQDVDKIAKTLEVRRVVLLRLC